MKYYPVQNNMDSGTKMNSNRRKLLNARSSEQAWVPDNMAIVEAPLRQGSLGETGIREQPHSYSWSLLCCLHPCYKICQWNAKLTNQLTCLLGCHLFKSFLIPSLLSPFSFFPRYDFSWFQYQQLTIKLKNFKSQTVLHYQTLNGALGWLSLLRIWFLMLPQVMFPGSSDWV